MPSGQVWASCLASCWLFRVRSTVAPDAIHAPTQRPLTRHPRPSGPVEDAAAWCPGGPVCAWVPHRQRLSGWVSVAIRLCRSAAAIAAHSVNSEAKGPRHCSARRPPPRPRRRLGQDLLPSGDPPGSRLRRAAEFSQGRSASARWLSPPQYMRRQSAGQFSCKFLGPKLSRGEMEAGVSNFPVFGR